MLHRVLDDLKGDDILARDGRIGIVDDVYFDDERWTVRYLVVDTGGWLPGRQVLLSPAAVEGPVQAGELPVGLTREQVERAPGAETDKPVSRHFAEAHAQYYGYPYYWEGMGLWGTPVPPSSSAAMRRAEADVAARVRAAEKAGRATHLRSGREVAGYAIQATDGDIGHVEDFVFDDGDWTIRDLVVDTRNWLPGGKKALVSPDDVQDIDWEERTVRVRLRKDEIRQAPEAR